MIISVHQPQYIPWLGYFDKIAKSDCFVFLDRVQYKDREFQNRNKIRTNRGPLWLTVPVATKGQGRQDICDVLIDNDRPWRRQHLKSLKAWYAKAEFFGEHIKFFEETYARDWKKLVDLNVHIVNHLLKQLAINKNIYFESSLNINAAKTDRIIEICRKLKADTYLSGIGGKGYLEEEKFLEAGIKLAYQDFTHPVYRQQFMSGENDFMPYLSVIDLLFNEGIKSLEILGLHS
ncbi:MAG: WbqC family protein [Candidatus Omnitrophica bacterium]|nr:WbqC family protein [Candidatus Omnitrophota bacterium]